MAEYLYTFHDHITYQVFDLELDYSEIPHSDYLLVYQSSNGGKVLVHKAHGKDELKANLAIATHLADLGSEVKLLPVNPRISTPQPDAQIDETLWEFKTLTNISFNAVDKALQKAKNQARRCVLDLRVNKNDFAWTELLASRWPNLQHRLNRAAPSSQIEKLIFIFENHIIRVDKGFFDQTNPFLK
jgi:hypothetical protein